MQDISEEEGEESSGSAAAETSGEADFNYILNLPLWSLTKERKDELLKQGESKVGQGQGTPNVLQYVFEKENKPCICL